MTGSTSENQHAAPFPHLRNAIQTTANTGIMVDYISILESNPETAALGLTIKYAPDKLIFTSQSFDNYATLLRDVTFHSLEEFTLTVLSDINNEVVPRWCQIVVWRPGNGNSRHSVVVEDRQPKWDNAALLSTIAPV